MHMLGSMHDDKGLKEIKKILKPIKNQIKKALAETPKASIKTEHFY